MAELFLDGCKLYHHLPVLNRWLGGQDIVPIHVEVSPTNACNYRCVFCYADHSEHALGTLPREPYLELMRSMGRMGVKSCLLAGDGEPLLNPACVDSIVVGAGAGVDMALNTNGLALQPEVGAAVLEHLTWLRFSVMSVEPGMYGKLHGTRAESLDKVRANIAAAVEIKRRAGLAVTLGVQQVLLPENGAEVADTARWAKEVGADYYVLKPFSLHPFNKDYQPEQIEQLPDLYREALLEAEGLSDEGFQKSNPIEQLDGWTNIPLVAFHSRHDQWMPFKAQESFIRALKARSEYPDEIEFVTFDRTGAPYEHIGFGRESAFVKEVQVEFVAKHLNMNMETT